MASGPSRDELIYGFQPVREVLRHRPQQIVRVLIAAAPGKRRREIESLAVRHRIPVEHVAERALREYGSAAVHNGFVIEARARPADQTGGDPNLVVIVEDVQDPRNLGALLRVCECAGVGRVIVRDRGSSPITAAVAKTAAGAVEYVNVERVPNSAAAIASLKQAGFWVYGAAAEGETVWDVDLAGQVALVIGGEANGLRRRTRETCDRLVALPVRGRIGSLNLATAASALLYEALRQRRPQEHRE